MTESSGTIHFDAAGHHVALRRAESGYTLFLDGAAMRDAQGLALLVAYQDQHSAVRAAMAMLDENRPGWRR